MIQRQAQYSWQEFKAINFGTWELTEYKAGRGKINRKNAIYPIAFHNGSRVKNANTQKLFHEVEKLPVISFWMKLMTGKNKNNNQNQPEYINNHHTCGKILSFDCNSDWDAIQRDTLRLLAFRTFIFFIVTGSGLKSQNWVLFAWALTLCLKL